MAAVKKEVKKRFPDIHKHFEEQDIQLLACFSQYFISLFLYDIPSNVGTRILDIFLLEGEKVLFNLLYKMISLKRSKILLLNSQDLLYYLRKKLVKECFEEYNLSTLFSSGRGEEHEMEELDNY
jgi:Rab-GTPase-TBC domain